MRGCLFVALAAMLGGCVGTPAPAPKVVTLTRTLAVAEPCSAHVAAPDFPDTAEAIRAAPDIHARAQLYAAGRQMRIAFEAELIAAMAGCQKAGAR
jgi:hypothetical protein